MKAAPILKVFLAVMCLVQAKQLTAENNDNYGIESVPYELLSNVNAEIRNYSLTFTVDDIDDAKLKCTYTVTVLNQAGQHFGKLYLTYNKFMKVKNLKGWLYDSGGNKLRELDDDEIKDRALISWATLYSDNRYKSAELYYHEFPYTVEFEYEIDYDGYLNWPSWMPEEEDASVEYSSYEIVIPSDSELRYRCYNFDDDPVITKDDDRVSYFWEVSKLPAFEKEPLGPPWSNQCISVIAAPNKFKFDDYQGDLSSWRNFGFWYRKLWDAKKEKLPAESVHEISALIRGTVDKKEQVKKIYKYMQSKTRYVNISIGIGGWQPIDAKKVSECGYGDCKALTNYMIALLGCAQIKAYPVLIYHSAIPYRLDKTFSNNQFNHVIACVPLEADTIWLECTSQTYPFNHIGSGNENRYGLVISEEGGKLIKTPRSNSDSNIRIRKEYVTVLADGKCTAQISTQYFGDRREEVDYVFNSLQNDASDDWLKENLNIPSFSITNQNFSHSGKNNRCSILNVSLFLPNHAAIMGNRLFFPPLLTPDKIFLPAETENRKYPLLFSYPFCNIDTIIYTIPSGFTIEAKPENIEIESENFKFSSTVDSTDSSTIVYTRHFEIESAEIPASDYGKFREFLQSVVRHDTRKIVLKR